MVFGDEDVGGSVGRRYLNRKMTPYTGLVRWWLADKPFTFLPSPSLMFASVSPSILRIHTSMSG